MGIGEKIKIRREYLGMSQEELAKKVGYKSRSTVNKIEKGINDITQSKIIAFANALDTTVDYLMGINQEERYGLGSKIKELRLQKNKALHELADELGIDPSILKEYENGTRKIPFEFMQRLADYFDVDFSNNVNFKYYKEANQSDLKTSLHIIEMTKRWNEEVGEANFTDEEVTKLIDYAKFLISQRKK